MTDPIDAADDLIEGNDWTGVSGDVEYTFLNPGYLPDYWTDGLGGLEGWLDDNFEDDENEVYDLALVQRKLTHYFLARMSDLVGGSGENPKTLPDDLFENLDYRVSFSDVATITFAEKTHSAGSPNDVGEISMAVASQDDDSLLGWGEFPGGSDEAGDVILGADDTTSSDGDITADFDPGQVGSWLILHELGHAIGLEDADDVYTGANNGFDNQKYTVMAYNKHADMDGGSDFLRPTTLQLLDIRAVQDIYGINWDTRDTATTYELGNGFGFYNDPDTLPANAEDDPFIYTIWDGGGTDTIDASGYNPLSFGAEIDLRQGRFSSIGKQEDGGAVTLDGVNPQLDDNGNVAIAYHAIIENATGTDDADTIIGNAWAKPIKVRPCYALMKAA